MNNYYFTQRNKEKKEYKNNYIGRKSVMQGISIIIPNYKGKNILEKSLPSIVSACDSYDGESEIIIVEDGGDDETAELLKGKYSKIGYYKLNENHGFGYTCNYGVAKSKFDIVVCLNNDVVVDKNFLKYLPEHFSEKDVFAVKIATKSIGDREKIKEDYILWRYLEFRNGWIYTPFKEIAKRDIQMKYTKNVAGCAAAFLKAKYLKLKGFDDLFLPFYSEETDLCYRALKRGWKIIYEPRSVVLHKEHETISKYFSRNMVEMVGERNMYYLIWKNISSKKYLFQHILFIPIRIIKGMLKGRVWPLLAFLKALHHLPKIFKARHVEIREIVRKDEEIFDCLE
ncbi:MAG: hypothetical protein A2452_03340 [Candidatus Firestonebacteria bacterium RIFOXYC2_FULL_39_67]|nr:MAG: hypothetical protein A2536_02755 [Candidatus Firestonebacteria bacterium RIFOXYD2_FULL_39_29]OGF55302.1 MAG: hypothetical protein A2452_03340 [Candidatus Firestonebacteria bacterium RIFOXYC2_FULL_39_67]